MSEHSQEETGRISRRAVNKGLAWGAPAVAAAAAAPMIAASGQTIIELNPIALGWTLNFDSQNGDSPHLAPASNVFDGDSSTFWHSNFQPLPHWVGTVAQGTQEFVVTSVVYTPRQGTPTGEGGGRALTARIEITTDGTSWATAPTSMTGALGADSGSDVEFTLSTPTQVRGVRFVAVTTKTHNDNNSATIAELRIFGYQP